MKLIGTRKVQRNNLITLPKGFCDIRGVQEGQEALIYVEGSQLVIDFSPREAR